MPMPTASPLHWRPDTPAKQHGLALVLGVILPLLLRLLTGVPAPGHGLLAFITLVAGFGCIVAGLLLYLWWVYAAWQHHDDESWATRWRLGRGPTAFSRHPQWLAVILMALGQALITPSLWFWVYAVGVVVGLNLLATRYDEPRLLQTHGAEFEDYRARVSPWLPWGHLLKTLRDMGQLVRNTIRNK